MWGGAVVCVEVAFDLAIDLLTHTSIPAIAVNAKGSSSDMPKGTRFPSSKPSHQTLDLPHVLTVN